MQITRLRLTGFKSFVEPADLLIEPGLTGVVGPNGCGKSNLLEALRWVMGETSYKKMRASAMEDVIFSGTAQRPARNMAEVVITLDNSSRTAPPSFNDSDVLEISRRIVRDAGSTYRINGREVRARDVQLLFADQATGAHSPALVQQNRIGELVNARPQARRLILEEAAGITGLHSRRHEAELRLRAAEDNLERLADITGQMNSQLAALKRQARQAARYKELGQKIRRTQALILYAKWSSACAERDREQAQLRQATTEIGTLTAAEAQARRALEEQQQALEPERREEAIAAALLQRLEMARQQLQAETTHATERLHETRRQIDALRATLEREQALQEEARAMQARLADEAQALTASDSDDDSTQEAARREAKACAHALAEAEARLATLTQEAAARQAERAQLAQHLATTRQRIERLRAERDAIARQQAAIEHDSEGQRQRLEAARAQLRKLDAQTETLTTGVEKATAAAHAASRNHAAARDAFEAARLKAQKLQTETQTLQSVLGRDDDAEGQRLSRALTVQDGYEAALAAALGDELEASLASDAPAHWRAMDIDPATLPPLPPPAVPLARFVSAPPALRLRLAMTGVVTPEDGEHLQPHLQPGQRLVSQAGDLWRWDGFTARADAPTAAAQRLRQRNRLHGLLEQLTHAQAARQAAQATLQTATDHLQAREAALQAARQRLADNHRESDAARTALGRLEHDAQDTHTRLATLDEAHNRVAASLQEAEDEQAALVRQQATLPATDHLAGQLSAQQAATQQARRRFTEAQAVRSALRQKAEARRQRLAALTRERNLWRSRQDKAQQQAHTLAARLAELENSARELEKLPQDFEHKQTELLAQITTAEARRKAAGDALARTEAALRQHNARLSTLQGKLATARETRAAITARLEAAAQRVQDLAREMADSLHCPPEACLAKAGLDAADEVPPLEELENTLQGLKLSRARLGQVNLRADLELAELSDKLDELSRESADLEQAIAKLHASIASLNAQGRKRLRQAFSQVNDHFKHLFTTLFGGGQARLELVASDDPLQAGLEIIASPPGKKPQVLSLLSGGEKALTALSLIFAVFLTNPAPICVLDEVDAPLDDANVERFCNLLEEMRRQTATRFLIITHHPMTMARMNRLFGVTMVERGVSRLVSVNLEEAERLRETAA